MKKVCETCKHCNVHPSNAPCALCFSATQLRNWEASDKARIAELERQNTAMLNKVGEQGTQIGTLEFVRDALKEQLGKTTATAANALNRLGMAEIERDEAYRVLYDLSPFVTNEDPHAPTVTKARAFVEGEHKEARDDG